MPPALRPKPPPRPRQDSGGSQPLLSPPAPPPKPKPFHTVSNPLPLKLDASHTHNCREILNKSLSSPCNCGETEERTRLPIHNSPPQLGVCGEGTNVKGLYSYIAVRGTENQTSKVRNPIFPENVKKRVCSQDARRQKWRAPAALPRPAHTLSPEDDSDDYLNIQGSVSEFCSTVHTSIEDETDYEPCDNVDGSVYENIDMTPGCYENVNKVCHSAGLDSMAKEQVMEDKDIAVAAPNAGCRKGAIWNRKSSEQLPEKAMYLAKVGPCEGEAVNTRRSSENQEMAMYSNVFDDGPYENVHLSGPR